MTDAQILALLQPYGDEPGALLCHGATDHTVLAWHADGALRMEALPLGAQQLAQTVLRHSPPRPIALEQAIDMIEEALMRWKVVLPTDRALLASGAFQRVADHAGGRQREDVEALFQRLASASLGHPSAAAGLPDDPGFMAATLLLRECMHHLGFVTLA